MNSTSVVTRAPAAAATIASRVLTSRRREIAEPAQLGERRGRRSRPSASPPRTGSSPGPARRAGRRARRPRSRPCPGTAPRPCCDRANAADSAPATISTATTPRALDWCPTPRGRQHAAGRQRRDLQTEGGDQHGHDVRAERGTLQGGADSPADVHRGLSVPVNDTCAPSARPVATNPPQRPRATRRARSPRPASPRSAASVGVKPCQSARSAAVSAPCHRTDRESNGPCDQTRPEPRIEPGDGASDQWAEPRATRGASCNAEDCRRTPTKRREAGNQSRRPEARATRDRNAEDDVHSRPQAAPNVLALS